MKKKKLPFGLTNKGLYTLGTILLVLIVGFFVYAYNVGFNNSVSQGIMMGHSADEVIVQLTNGTNVTAQSLLKDGVPLPNPINTYLLYFRFNTKYSTLMANETFRTWLTSNGGGNGWPISGGDDHGWYIRTTDPTSANYYKFIDTSNKLCTYFMGDDSFAVLHSGTFSGGDYGSDNGNVAYYWNKTNSVWLSEGHGDNGAIDIVSLVCSASHGFLPRASNFISG